MLQIRQLVKTYVSGGAPLTVFAGLDLEVRAGETVAVTGPSGAGKSTLLHLIAGLDEPTSGRIRYKDFEITALDECGMAAYRNRELGYVWQQHYLLREFTAEENVMLPLLIRGTPRAAARATAIRCLEETGLGGKARNRAGELSGGEQQRAAIARALAGSPSLLLADEPTGNLDEATAESVFQLFSGLSRAKKLTCVLVTHNPRFARQCDRVMELRGGALHPIG